MKSRVWLTSLVASCAFVLALGSAACNKANDNTGEQLGHEGATLTLTGCLQKADGLNNYILTQVTRPNESPVATSGRGQASGAVQQEQMREARHSYRLDGHNSELGDLVGKQVRISGTIDQNSDLNRDKTASIDANDLAKVDVETVEKVADACGEQGNAPQGNR